MQINSIVRSHDLMTPFTSKFKFNKKWFSGQEPLGWNMNNNLSANLLS